MRGLLALLGLVILVGCSAPKAELDADRMGRLFIDAVQRGDWPAIDKGIEPQLMASPTHAARIEAVRKTFPADPPWSIRLLASRQVGANGAPDQERAELQYLYQFAERRAVIDLTLVPVGWKKVIPATAQTPRKESSLLPTKPEQTTSGGPGGYELVRVYKAMAMSYTEVTKPDEAAQAFWAPGRTSGQWLFLGLAAATPVFMLWTVVRVLRAPVLGGRLFWALACFAGMGTLWMDWTSGITGLLPYSLRLMGFGLEQGPSPLSPWMVSLTLPIGALAASLRLALQRLRT
jgi:hypothetical protein